MQMLYNSDNFAVVRFDLSAGDPPAAATAAVAGAAGTAGATLAAAPARGGYEIVDKFARKEIFIQGVLAENFQTEVQALIEKSPSQEAFVEFLGRYTSMMQHPLVLH